MRDDADTGCSADRVAGELNQPGCSMTGFAFELAALRSDLAVVVFGERDCINAFPRLEAEFLAEPRWRFYTTALRETDVVAGLAEARLEECLRAVALRTRPRGIVVLSTCLTGMIGADPDPVCRSVEAETGTPIVAVRTSGLKPRTQAEVADHVAQVLATLFATGAVPEPDAVDLVGYPTLPSPRTPGGGRALIDEARDVLARLGLRLNAAVPGGASVADWTAFGRGGIVALSDRALFRQFLRTLDLSRTVEVPPPKGVAATDRFYRRLAERAGRDPGPVLDALPARAEALAAIGEARRRFAGARLAYGVGSHHNFRPDLLAREGLADLPQLVELGFEVEAVIQERDRPEVHARIRRHLAALGVDVPYRLFYEPSVLAPALRDGRFACAYLAPFLADQAAQAGIPMLALGDLEPGYGGAAASARFVVGALGPAAGGTP